MANKISVILDVAADKAVSGIKGFRKSVDEADGAIGKVKAGASSAFDSIKANAGVAALAAGSALVAFGAKGVAAFNDLALEADKLRNVSGLALEDASKWIAVGDDIGVSAETLEKSFGKFGVQLGKGGKALEEFGIGIVKAGDGTTDANATFLNAIDTIKGIQDPTKKAAAAQAAFGKGWQDMAELINMGSADIVTAMGEVSEAQIIDEGELAKAKQYRASMDNLQDSVKDLAMNLGEELTPAISTVADVLATIAPAVGKVVGVVGDAFIEMSDMAYEFGAALADMADALPFVEMADTIGPTLYEWKKLERGTADLVSEFGKGKPTMEAFIAAMVKAGVSQEAQNLAMIQYRKQLDGVVDETGEVVEVTDELTEAVDYAKDAEDANKVMIEQVNTTYEAQRDAVEAAAEALRELTSDMIDAVGSAFNLEEATLNLNSAYADYQEQVLATTEIVADSETGDREKEQALRDLRSQEIGVASDALATAEAYAQEMGAADGSAESAQLQKDKLQELAAAMPELRDEIQKYIDKLNAVPGVIRTAFEITATGARITPTGDTIGGGMPRYADGGFVSGPVGAPQLAIVHGGEYITPHSQIAGGWGGMTSAGGSAAPSVTLVVEGNIYGDKHLRTQLDTWARNVQREVAGAR